MSEIKPVYQAKRFDETGWADVTQESYKNCELAQTILETRILYPAATYEALQKELSYSKMAADAEAEFANEYKAKFEALKAENEAQAKRIEFLEYEVKHMKDALRAYGDEDIDDD